MKRFWMVLLLVVLLVGCAPQKSKPFVFISPNRQHPVVRTMALGFFEACRDLKVECKDYSFDGVDFTQMATAVDQVLASGTSGAIAFVDAVVYEQDRKLIAAGVPTVTIHVKVPSGVLPGLLAWVATDATDYAERSADYIGAKLGGTGVIAITQGSLNDVENEVSQSFTNRIKQNYPNIKVLPPEMEGFDPPQAIAKAVALLQRNSAITAAFGTTGGSPTTWAKAVEQVGRKPGSVVIVGMDYTRANLDLVKSGQVSALVGQPLYEETYKALSLLVAHTKKQPVAYDNPFPAPIITIQDIEKYYGIADRVDAAAAKR